MWLKKVLHQHFVVRRITFWSVNCKSLGNTKELIGNSSKAWVSNPNQLEDNFTLKMFSGPQIERKISLRSADS